MSNSNSFGTVASTCAHVAKALNAAEPTETRPWEAWLSASDDNVFHIVDFGRFIRDDRDESRGAFLPPTRVASNDMANLDRTARDWLTYWLLEIGMRGFEDWLAGKVVPDWLRAPDLA